MIGALLVGVLLPLAGVPAALAQEAEGARKNGRGGYEDLLVEAYAVGH